MELKDYLRILQRRWKTILIVSIVIVSLSWVYITKEPIFHKASCLVTISESPYPPIGTEYPALFQLYFTKATRIALIKTRPVLTLALKGLGEYFPDVKEENLDSYINLLKNSISIEQDKETEMISISAVDRNPQKAEAMVKEVATAFAKVSDDLTKKGIDNAIGFIQTVLTNREEDIKHTELELARLPKLLIPPELEFEIGQEEQMIRKFIDQIGKNDLEIGALEEKIRFFKSSLSEGAINVKSLSTEPRENITRLRSEIDTEEKKLSELLRKYKKEHPQVKATMDEIERLKMALEDAVKKEETLSVLAGKFDMLAEIQKMEMEKNGLIKQKETMSIEMKKAQEKYTKLLQRRSALTHKEMPEESAKRLSLEGQLEFLKDSKQKLVASKISLEINKQLLNPPIEKVEAGKAIPLPQKGTKSIPFTILTALVIGIGSAYLLEYLNTSIRTEHDIRRYINLPLIGVMLKIKDPEQRLLINAAPKSPLSEAFNTTGTILETYATENNAKIFMIASSKAEEGKSTITTNLGVALARSGARVIIIDTDLRKAVLHRFFNIDNTKGLSSYVLARAEVSSYENLAPPPGSVSIDDIIKPTEIEGLSLIPAGPHPKNPVAILKSKVIKDLLSELKTRTDIILVDVPPVNIAVDTLVLAPIVDAIVLLISAGETNKDEVTFAKRMIESARGKLIGCMLNKVTIESRGYYYYYYYYYYYDRYKYYREE